MTVLREKRSYLLQFKPLFCSVLFICTPSVYAMENPPKKHFLEAVVDGTSTKVGNSVEKALGKTLEKWIEPHQDKMVGGLAGGAVGYLGGGFICGYVFSGEEALVKAKAALCQNAVALGTGAVGGIIGWGVPRFFSDISWGFWSIFGYIRPPEGIERVHPYHKYHHPDGAIAFEKLFFDPTDPSTMQLKTAHASMVGGDTLKNGIFYGDAGTGKSSFVRSFAHNSDFEVYSVSGGKMDFEGFRKLTVWLKSTSFKNSKKILLDISEGDRLLKNIAINQEFKDYFKQQFESNQARFAIIFSCNFTEDVSHALSVIARDDSLQRRMGERIRFSVPSPMVRASLLKRGVFKYLAERYPKEKDAKSFFEHDFFGDKNMITDVFVPATEGFSHNNINTFAVSLVRTYFQAEIDRMAGVDKNLEEFAYLNTNGSLRVKDPINAVVERIEQGPQEENWLRQEQENLTNKTTERLLAEIPLLKLKAQQRKLLKAIHEGILNDDEEDDEDSEDSPDGKKNALEKLIAKKKGKK